MKIILGKYHHKTKLIKICKPLTFGYHKLKPWIGVVENWEWSLEYQLHCSSLQPTSPNSIFSICQIAHCTFIIYHFTFVIFSFVLFASFHIYKYFCRQHSSYFGNIFIENLHKLYIFGKSLLWNTYAKKHDWGKRVWLTIQEEKFDKLEK